MDQAIRRMTAILLLALAGCAGADTGRVPEVLLEHLSTVAPAGPAGAGWSETAIEVVDVRPRPEGDLAVRFHVYDPRHPAAADAAMRGATHTAYVSPDQGGYRVRGYADELARSVAVLVAADRRGRYDDLLGTLLVLKDTARLAIREWAKPLRDEIRAGAPDPRLQAIRAELDRFAPAERLRSGIASRWSPPPGLEWGVIDQNAADGAEVLYLRRADKPHEICAVRIGPSAPPEYDWLAQAFPTCRGRGGVYVEELPPTTVLEEIRASGMVVASD